MKLLSLIALWAILVSPSFARAYYTQDNFWEVAHEAPAWFEADGAGGFYGATVGGTPFTQRPVVNDLNLRMHKFIIGSAFFYISDRGIIQAEHDLAALSIYFTLG